jgi:hypothetical protein
MVNCPVCNNPLPPIRMPTSLKQGWKGGWTCENCGAEIDRKGKLIMSGKEKKKEQEEKLYKEEYIKEKARLQANKDHKKK